MGLWHQMYAEKAMGVEFADCTQKEEQIDVRSTKGCQTEVMTFYSIHCKLSLNSGCNLFWFYNMNNFEINKICKDNICILEYIGYNARKLYIVS